MANFLDLLGLEHYDSKIKEFIEVKMNEALEEAISGLSSALKFKGLISTSVSMHTAYPNASVGDVYFISDSSVKLTYYDGNGTSHSNEQMEVGDAIICIQKATGTTAATQSHWGTLQVNWNVKNEGATLLWGQSQKVATVGGVDIRITLPAKSTISPSDIGAATTAQGTKADNALQNLIVNGSTVVPDANKAVSISVATSIRVGDNGTTFNPEQSGSGTTPGRVTLTSDAITNAVNKITNAQIDALFAEE